MTQPKTRRFVGKRRPPTSLDCPKPPEALPGYRPNAPFSIGHAASRADRRIKAHREPTMAVARILCAAPERAEVADVPPEKLRMLSILNIRRRNMP